MKRAVIGALSIISLILFLLFAGLWIHSAVDGHVSVRRTTHGIVLVPKNNRVLDQPGGGPELLEANLPIMRANSASGIAFLGFEYRKGGIPNAALFQIPEFWLVIIPYWFLLILSGALPGWWWYSQAHLRAWRNAGRCLHCGYDLRESKDRCPECGAAIPVGRVLT